MENTHITSEYLFLKILPRTRVIAQNPQMFLLLFIGKLKDKYVPMLFSKFFLKMDCNYF